MATKQTVLISATSLHSTLKICRSARATEGRRKVNVDQTNIQGQSLQFSRDDVARIVVSVLIHVFEALNVQHEIEGVAVLPAGDLSYLVDIVMRNLSTTKTRGVTIAIPPTEEKKTNALEWSKKFEVLSINRQDLRTFGLTSEQVTQLSDEDMEQIAAELYHRYDLNGFQEDVVFVARLVLAEKDEGGVT